MSKFKREIKDFAGFKNKWRQGFLNTVDTELIKSGNAILAFRNDEATVYYNGNQLCNVSAPDFDPTVNELFLPLCRSHALHSYSKNVHQYINEKTWVIDAKLTGTPYTFASILPEICSNIKFHQTPESFQVSKLYKYSPLNINHNSKFVLLDVEAVFSATRGFSDRIDIVLYHKEEKRLIFIEVKGLWDNRLKSKNGSPAEIIDQMGRYNECIKGEGLNIKTQYDRVIQYYNSLGGIKLDPIEDIEPLLGLLLVGFKRNNVDSNKRKEAKKILRENKIKFYDIGDTENINDASLTEFYDILTK